LKVLTLRPILAAWQRNRNHRSQSAGTSTRSPAKPIWLGEAKAPDEAAAIEKAAAEFMMPAI
jgi:hypothetical protein